MELEIRYQDVIKNISKLNKNYLDLAKNYLDNLTKPIGSLGQLENIYMQLAGIFENLTFDIEKKNILIFCADNGVVEEKVSCCPKEYTKIVAENFTKGITAINKFSEFAKNDITIIDIGIDADIINDDILNYKISYGTKNFTKEPAMSEDDCIKAIEIGINLVYKLYQNGYSMLGTGEMGIGNTTTSAAITSVLLNIEPEKVTGRGAGLDDEGYLNKINTIKKGITITQPDANNPIDVLQKLGGLDIAGMVGAFLGAAYFRLPIVIDGVISAAAALVSYKINPFTKYYMIASHLSAESAAKYILDYLELQPLLHLNLRLGEGSGCPLAFNIIDAGVYTLRHMASMDEAKLNKQVYVDIRK